MSLEQFLILLGAGLMAAGGQFAITAAYNNAAGKDISIYDYSQILFAAILGFIFLNQIRYMEHSWIYHYYWCCFRSLFISTKNS